MWQQLKSINQYVLGFLAIGLVCSISLPFRKEVPYEVTAYILLAAVSLLALSFRIGPVLFCALLSAAALDLLFIEPYYTLHIDSAHDGLLLTLFFAIALVNAVLTQRIRKAERLANIRETRWNSMRLYETLLDSLSHELRTPISTLMGGVGMLQQKEGVLNSRNQEELLREMEKAAQRLDHQVGNLLNMSRLESGHIKPLPDWVDLNELFYDVSGQLKTELMDHQLLILRNDSLPLLKLDYGLTAQIIYNLMANGANHTPKGASIKVETALDSNFDVDAATSDASVLTIKISDNGHGFPQSEIGRVFDKFYRLEKSGTGGSGLGLSIVKGFVQAQGGTIHLANRPQGGAEFTLTFPVAVLNTNHINHG